MKKLLCGVLLLAALVSFAPAAMAETGKIGTADYTFENGALTVTGGEFTLEQWQALIGTNGQPIAPGDVKSVTFQADDSDKKTKLTGSAYRMFYIPDVDETGNEIDKSFYTQLKKVDLSGLDTSGVTDMSWMFANCTSLETVDLSGFDTSNVTDMEFMFLNCSSLKELDVSGFDTSNVTHMLAMFARCSSLTSLDLSNFDTSNAIYMDGMFDECTSLTSLDLSGWDTSKVTNMSWMFSYCTSLETLDLRSFNTSTANMSAMFDGCTVLVNVTVSQETWTGDISLFADTPLKDKGPTKVSTVSDTSGSIGSATYIFKNASGEGKLTVTGGEFTLEQWQAVIGSKKAIAPSTVKSIAFSQAKLTGGSAKQMFYSKYLNLISADLSGLDTSGITDMSWMFADCTSLETVNLSGFGTSNVTDMEAMFLNCSSLKTLDVSGFDTSNVTDMHSLFSGCSSLKTLDVSRFDTSTVSVMNYMFNGCSSLTALDVSRFNTSNVRYMLEMFARCSSLMTLDLSSFDTSNVTDMSYMFSNCSSLTELDLSSFTTSDATNMIGMFEGCTAKVTINEETWKGEKPVVTKNWTLTLSPATLSDITTTAGIAISPVTLTAILQEGADTVSADKYSLAWTVSPTLPNGLSFANGTLSGTPTAAIPAAIYTLTATATENTVSLAVEAGHVTPKSATASVTVKITVSAPAEETPTSDKGSGDETKKTTEEKAADVVKDLNPEASSVMDNALNSTNTETKEAAQEVASILHDSLSTEEIAGLSAREIEFAVQNKKNEAADAVVEATEGVKDPYKPAGTDLLEKSTNDSLKAAQNLSVKPKVVTPKAVDSTTATKMKQDFTEKASAGDVDANVDVDAVKAAAANLQTEDAIEIETASGSLEAQLKQLESLLTQIAETLVNAVNPKTQNKGMVVATSLPKMTPKASGFFPMAVNLRNLTPGRKLMFWPSVEFFNQRAAAQSQVSLADVSLADDQEGKFFFLDEAGNPVSTVSGDAAKMSVVPYLAEGTDYSTAFITADATSNDKTELQTLAEAAQSGGESPTSDKSSGGCDAGFGLAGMLALAAGLLTLRKK